MGGWTTTASKHKMKGWWVNKPSSSLFERRRGGVGSNQPSCQNMRWNLSAGFLANFRDIYTTVTSILKVEGPNQFWLITQSILNRFG